MEDYTVLAFTEPGLFHRLLEKAARPYPRSNSRGQPPLSRAIMADLWSRNTPRAATCRRRLFEEFVVPLHGPPHGSRHPSPRRLRPASTLTAGLKNILDLIAGIGADGLDPIEPPPQGDVELREVRRRYGRQLVLFGNLEVADIERLPVPQFRREGETSPWKKGRPAADRGFVLMPSASPYGRELSSLTLCNYETMVREVEEW